MYHETFLGVFKCKLSSRISYIYITHSPPPCNNPSETSQKSSDKYIASTPLSMKSSCGESPLSVSCAMPRIACIICSCDSGSCRWRYSSSRRRRRVLVPSLAISVLGTSLRRRDMHCSTTNLCCCISTGSFTRSEASRSKHMNTPAARVAELKTLPHTSRVSMLYLCREEAG